MHIACLQVARDTSETSFYLWESATCIGLPPWTHLLFTVYQSFSPRRLALYINTIATNLSAQPPPWPPKHSKYLQPLPQVDNMLTALP